MCQKSHRMYHENEFFKIEFTKQMLNINTGKARFYS